MLSWLFKKRVKPAASSPSPAPTPTTGPTSAKGTAQPTRKTAARASVQAPPVDWAAPLAAAQGDDAALLRVAQSAAPLTVKMAAVEALVSETVLRQAEREFRTHDRKVHRLAKQRLEATVAQREARVQAQALLAQAEALAADEQLPVNRVAALDRDWAALPATLLEPVQTAAFVALRARLALALRTQADALQAQQRWTAEAQQQLQAWPGELRAAAEQGCRADVAALGSSLAALRQSRPDAPATAKTDAALAQALQTAAWVESQLARLEAAPETDLAACSGTVDETAAALAAGASDPLVQPETDQNIDEVSAGSQESPSPASSALAAVAIPAVQATAPAAVPLGLDPALARVLQQRQEARARASARAQAEPAMAPAARPSPRASKPRAEAPSPELQQHADTLLLQAEAALAEGQLGALQQHLQALEPLLAQKQTAWPEALRARHQAVWVERARLKDWQQWGGARAREDLVAEAQALALQVQPLADSGEATASAEAAAPAAPAAADGTVELVESAQPADASEAAPATPAEAPRKPSPRPGPKLNLKALADSIQALRQRWKEIDRQGAAATAEQWQAFDAALHTAYAPLAVQHAALKVARRENQAAREALLDTLEALALPGGAETPAQPDWRTVQRELAAFQAAWRKLGPLEHTAPAASREALQQRLQRAVARVENPLRAGQDTAVAEREHLIARAQACLPAGGDRPQADAARQVRELQAEWQEHARGLPLPRGIENALWARFKAATDAVFAHREAAFAERDAELAAHLAAAEALVQRLLEAGSELPVAQIERTLAEVDRAWSQGGELPRGTVDALEARFRSARAAAVQRQGEGLRLQWQAQCDDLVTRLHHCEALEDTGGPAAQAQAQAQPQPTSGGAPDSPSPPGLPKAWEQPLAQRAARAAGAGPLTAGQVDELLLRLETTLNLPAAPEWQAARQQLKLRALKDTLEGRSPPAQAQPAEALRALLLQGGLDLAQRARLQALVAALRQGTPGTLAQ